MIDSEGVILHHSFCYLYEVFVYAGVVVEFGMEGCGQLVPLLDGYDVVIDGGDRVASVTEDGLHIRCADEGQGEGISDSVHMACGVETAQLATVGVAAHTDVHRAQMVL